MRQIGLMAMTMSMSHPDIYVEKPWRTANATAPVNPKKTAKRAKIKAARKRKRSKK